MYIISGLTAYLTLQNVAIYILIHFLTALYGINKAKKLRNQDKALAKKYVAFDRTDYD